MKITAKGVWRAAVRIHSYTPRSRSGRFAGSGVLVTYRGRVVVATVYHVVEGTERLVVTTCDGVEMPATVLRTDRAADIAILQVTPKPGQTYDAAEFADELPPKGERVQAVGWGHGELGLVEGKALGFTKFTGMTQPDVLEFTGGAMDGDSGGPVFNSRGEVVGLITATNGQTTMGPQAGLIQTLCAASPKWHALPWRAKTEAKIAALGQAIESHSTQTQIPVPPPPPQQPPVCPAVDLGPIVDRLNKLELQTDTQAKDLEAVKARQDRIVKVADDISASVGEQFPKLNAAYLEAKQSALDAAKQAEAAAGIAGGAKGAAESVKGEAEAAKTEAAKATETVTKALDEDTPGGLFARLKARIETAKDEGIRAGLAGLAWPWGAIAGVVLFLVYRDIRAKIATGDPLLVEKVASRVHERLGPVRERIVDRFRPDPPQTPPQPPT